MAARRKSAKSRRSSASPRRGAKKAAKRGSRPAKKVAKKASRKVAKKVARRAAPRPKKARRAAATPRPRAAAPAAAVDVMLIDALNGRPAVNDIGITHHHSDYTSHDVEGVRRFYTETLGLGNALYIPEHGYLSIFFSPRSSLGFMAPMPGAPPESWSPPGEPNIYLFVEDVDRAHQLLTERGVNFEMAPTDTPWGHRLAICRDPEGRRVCLAKNLKG